MTDFKEGIETLNPLVQAVETAFSPPNPEVVERLKGREEWVQKQASGRVHIQPPQLDKGKMLTLSTNNIKLYELFNDAAQSITKQWGGFHQFGWEDKSGLTAWELRNLPENVSEEEILQKLKDEMLKQVKEYY